LLLTFLLEDGRVVSVQAVQLYGNPYSQKVSRTDAKTPGQGEQRREMTEAREKFRRKKGRKGTLQKV